MPNKNGAKTFVHYLSAAEAIVVKRDNAAFEYYFPYTDHLGSIVAVTNTSGALVAEQNFDAWGRKRNANTWAYDNVQVVPSWLYRGFTGHEHLDAFGLINMNARLYDAVLGRMLSPDNFVGDAGSQGFNRYSYANNNPLVYTDPSGNEPITLTALLVTALVQGTVSVAINGVINVASGIFNSNGAPYPQVEVQGYGFVPFPSGTLVRTDPSLLRSAFNKAYREGFEGWWRSQGRPWPLSSSGNAVNIHHIKPLGWGGTNDYNNLVPLFQPGEHQPFTSWWAGYR